MLWSKETYTLKKAQEPSGCGYLKKIKFCPKCGSKDVFFASGLPQLWSLWECKNCGYRGVLILEDGKLAEKLRNDWNKK